MEDCRTRTLRLANRAMTTAEAEDVLRCVKVGRLGMCRNDQPYVVPLYFTYDNGHIYFHCADAGLKIEFLHSNPSVCFEADEHVATTTAPVACNCDAAYRSVIVFGTARILTSLKEKVDAMRLIAGKYMGEEPNIAIKPELVDRYRSQQGSKTVVVDIAIEQITGKRNDPV